MFEFTNASSAENVVGNPGYIADALARWPVLTHFDVSTINSERQLVAMVKERCSLSQANAEDDVREWISGKAFQATANVRPTPHEAPLFFNELGVNIIEVGVAAFDCMGVMPPHDHPHVYLTMGELAGILCPYCSTEYRLNPALRWNETKPANCWAPQANRTT